MAGWQCKTQGERVNFNEEGGGGGGWGTVKDFTGYLFSQYLYCFTYFVSIEIDKNKSAS